MEVDQNKLRISQCGSLSEAILSALWDLSSKREGDTRVLRLNMLAGLSRCTSICHIFFENCEMLSQCRDGQQDVLLPLIRDGLQAAVSIAS